jgi:hypothetical protein
MTNDRFALEQLRVSLARLAQVEKLDYVIPGKPEPGASIEVLVECAKQDRGWNMLMVMLLGKALVRSDG